MYQFSRSIYRQLADNVKGDTCISVGAGRQRLLEACESTFDRLASDRHYFARPARTLFNDIRVLFPIEKQMRVYSIVESHIRLATAYVDRQAKDGVTLTGVPLSCHATTRRGTACQREPLPGSRYCPSHKHLDSEFEAAHAA
jgi:hypothetical protein